MKYSIGAVAVFCVLSMVACREKPASGPAVLNRQLTLPTGSPASTPANPVLPGTTVASNGGSGAINPAHGQPGHRCDIAVGAPLPAASQGTNPAAPSLNAATNPAIQPASLPATNTGTTAATGTGLNPAHGQPGHRCDIAVGAPLNSKPTTSASPTTTTTTSTPLASKPAPLQPDTLFAKGLNPAHGQPGHRCDVAVGKPLSEAKKVEPLATSPIPLQPPAGN